MTDFKVKIRDGCRGGQEQFQWNSIKEQDFKDRECYLGQSTKIGTMGKFGRYSQHDWFSKKRDSATTIQEERKSIQAYEEELMQEALGLKPKKLLLAKKQLTEEELKEFLKKDKDKGREAMGPQKKVVKNEFGEQVATSNEDFIADAARDSMIAGLGFASHRDAKLEKIKADAFGTSGQLQGSKNPGLVAPLTLKGEVVDQKVKLEAVKREVKEELTEEAAEAGDNHGVADALLEVKLESDSKKRRLESDGLDEKSARKAAKKEKKEKKLMKAEKKLKKNEKKLAKAEKKAAKEAEKLRKAKRRSPSSSSSSS